MQRLLYADGYVGSIPIAVEIQHGVVEVTPCLVRAAATRIQSHKASTRVLVRVDGARAPCDREVI